MSRQAHAWYSGASGYPLCPRSLGGGAFDLGVYSVAGLSDGRVVACGVDYDYYRVRVWDPRDGRRHLTLRADEDVQVSDLAVLNDGHLLLGDNFGQVLLWRPAAGSQPLPVGQHEGRAVVAVVAGTWAVSAGRKDQTVRIRNRAQLDEPTAELVSEVTSLAAATARSQDSGWLAICHGSSLSLWKFLMGSA